MPSKLVCLVPWFALVACTAPPAPAADTAAAADAADATAETAPDAAEPLDSAADAAADPAPDTAALPDAIADMATFWGCAALCGNGVCDPGEAPGSCSDCADLAQAALACLEAQCVAEWAVCSPKPGCANLAKCLVQCGGTPACADACELALDTTGVLGAWQPIVGCAAAKGCMAKCGNGTCDAGESSGTCPVDCKLPVAGNRLCEHGESPLTCGFDCGIADLMGCRKLACPAQWAACAADAACAPVLTCLEACSSFACWQACTAPVGASLPPELNALYTCAKKVCDFKTKSVCGDGQCSGSQTCPKDCTAPPAVCGNGACEPGESSLACAGDCGAPTGVATCAKKHCPSFDAACKAEPSCAAALACRDACPLNAQWKPCIKQCGAEASLFAWWLLLPLDSCAQAHGCKPDLPPYCGDQICHPGETAATCEDDCFEPQVCGDHWCAKSVEDAQSCPADCVVPATCETAGCGPKNPNLVCCKVSGVPACVLPPSCDL